MLFILVEIASVTELIYNNQSTDLVYKKQPSSHQFIISYGEAEGSVQKLGFATFSEDVAAMWVKGLKYLLNNNGM